MPPRTPRIVVNLKTYPEATGKRAVALARAASRLEDRKGVTVALAVQAVDAAACAATGARVYAQHFDRVQSSQSTGATRLESLIEAGIEGSLINHSEKRLDPKTVAWNVEQARKARLVTLVCAENPRETAQYAKLSPTLVAVEPPQLIGGDISVTTADPSIIRKAVAAVRKVAPRMPVLCGAGVKNGDDVAAARELGSYGVLVASGVAKAKDPKAALADLIRGIQ